MIRSLNTNYTVDIKVLTPVHIGAGNEKNWQRSIDFIEDAGKVYVLKQDLLFSKMSEQLLSDYTRRLEHAKFREAEKLLIDHIDLEEVSHPVFEYKGGPLSNEIKTLTRSGTGMPYIPGSSLKGAIVSAIFHYLHYQAGPAKHNRFINNDLLGTFAGSIMHFLRPGDASVSKTGISNVSLFNLYAKGSEWESDYKDDFIISIEHFRVGSEGRFRLSVADGLGALIKEMEQKTQKPLLPKYYTHIIQTNPGIFLFKLINDYTREHLRKELLFFEKHDEAPDTDLIIKEIKSLMARTEVSEKTCVLRMSAGSGFHGITGDWRFKNHDSTLDQPDQENLTWSQRNRRKEPARYKSRKVMANGDELLMGFVELRLV